MSETIFDSEPLSVRCPDCGHEIARTVGFFRRSPTLNCPGCNASIDFDGTGLDEGVLGAQRTIENAVERLSKL